MTTSAVRQGMRVGSPLAVVVVILGLSFGVLASPVLGTVEPVVMSAVLFAGSSQFAVVAILSGGGGVTMAVIAGVLLNLRYAPMAISVAPFVAGGPLRRGLIGQAIVDGSWALSSRPDGRYDPGLLLGVALVSYPGWVIGTALGVLAGDLVVEPGALGLDALLPAFFLSLIVNDVRADRTTLAVVLTAVVIAIGLTPVAPVGVPLLAACAAAFVGAICRPKRGNA